MSAILCLSRLLSSVLQSFSPIGTSNSLIQLFIVPHPLIFSVPYPTWNTCQSLPFLCLQPSPCKPRGYPVPQLHHTQLAEPHPRLNPVHHLIDEAEGDGEKQWLVSLWWMFTNLVLYRPVILPGRQEYGSLVRSLSLSLPLLGLLSYWPTLLILFTKKTSNQKGILVFSSHLGPSSICSHITFPLVSLLLPRASAPLNTLGPSLLLHSLPLLSSSFPLH